MLLYERITFLLVSGTLGLFVLAVLIGAWGIALTYNPRLNALVTAYSAKAASYAKKTYKRLRRKYEPMISWRVPVRP